GVDALHELELHVLGLAGHPGGHRARPGHLRVRAEALGIRHRYPGPPQGALEGARDVPVRGEPQPPALGVAEPQLLHRCSRGIRVISPTQDALPTMIVIGGPPTAPMPMLARSTAA